MQMIVECPRCASRVAILCNSSTVLFETPEEQGHILRLSLIGSTRHICNY